MLNDIIMHFMLFCSYRGYAYKITNNSQMDPKNVRGSTIFFFFLGPAHLSKLIFGYWNMQAIACHTVCMPWLYSSWEHSKNDSYTTDVPGHVAIVYKYSIIPAVQKQRQFVLASVLCYVKKHISLRNLAALECI